MANTILNPIEYSRYQKYMEKKELEPVGPDTSCLVDGLYLSNILTFQKSYPDYQDMDKLTLYHKINQKKLALCKKTCEEYGVLFGKETGKEDKDGIIMTLVPNKIEIHNEKDVYTASGIFDVNICLQLAANFKALGMLTEVHFDQNSIEVIHTGRLKQLLKDWNAAELLNSRTSLDYKVQKAKEQVQSKESVSFAKHMDPER